MAKVWHIAINTFREASRDRVLYVIAFFAALMMLASTALGWISAAEQAQVVTHFSLAVTSFFSALIAVFVGTSLIHKEIEKRTIYTILSKPVARWQFILGKFAGLLLVMFCIVLGMGIVACGFLWYAGGEITAIYVQAMALIFGEAIIVTALAIFFSALASPILAAIFTFSAYLVGQVTPSLLDLISYEPVVDPAALAEADSLSRFASQSHSWLKPLSAILYHVLPNLTHFQLRNRAVYGPPLRHGAYFIDGECGQAIIYAICYAAALLAISIWVFERKRL